MSRVPEKGFTNSAVFLGICIIPMAASLMFGAVSTGTFAFVALLMGIFQIFILFDFWRSKRFYFDTNLLQIPILALVLLGLFQLLPIGTDGGATQIISERASSALTMAPMLTKFAIIRYTLLLIFFGATLVYVNRPSRLRKLVFTVIVFAGIMAFIGILQRLASPTTILGIRQVDYAFPFATYINQHHFAAFMELTIGLSLGMLFGNSVEKDKRLLLLIAVVLMGIAVLLTGSRGAFLSLIGVILFLVLVYARYGTVPGKEPSAILAKKNLTIIGASAALLILLLIAVIWLGQESSLQRIGSVSQPDFSTGRTHFWSVALQIFTHHPILGTGLDSFQMAYPQFDTWNGKLRVEQAHNDYLQTLTDAGIIGFLIIASFIVLLYKKGFSTVKRSGNLFRRGVAIGALAGCTGIFLHSFVDFPLRTNANAFFFLLLVAMATVKIEYPRRFKKPTLVQPETGI
ncbi:MAG: O-antigen ligase family protein [Pyrinomonadaceae bacterium]